MSFETHRIIRYTLGTLLGFAALNAFGGGYYAISGAKGVPLEWLQGSPFESYLVPGLILFGIVGGAFLVASVAVLRRLRFAKSATYSSVLIVSVWLLVQMVIIGYVSWMQPATAAVSLIIFFLARTLYQERYHEIGNK